MCVYFSLLLRHRLRWSRSKMHQLHSRNKQWGRKDYLQTLKIRVQDPNLCLGFRGHSLPPLPELFGGHSRRPRCCPPTGSQTGPGPSHLAGTHTGSPAGKAKKESLGALSSLPGHGSTEKDFQQKLGPENRQRATGRS